MTTQTQPKSNYDINQITHLPIAQVFQSLKNS